MPETSEPAPNDDRPLSVSQVADLFGVSTTAVRDWADSGRLRYFWTPAKHRRFWRADVEAFLVAGEPKPKAG